MRELFDRPQVLNEEMAPVPPSTSTSLVESGYLELAIILAKRKFLILGFTVAVGILAGIVSLLLPNIYTANAKILPPQQNQSMSLSMLGQLSPLVGATAAKDFGIRNQNDLYVAMLQSRTVEDKLIARFSLMSVYGKNLLEDARRRLNSNSDIVAGKDGVISISVDDRDPRRAAELANGYVEELERLTKILAVTDAGKQRRFFERELQSANEELAKAELALEQTEEHTGLIHLDSQSRVMMESLARLKAEMTAKQVQVQAMRSYATPQNPDLIHAESELAALQGQVARSEGRDGTMNSSDIAMNRIPRAALEYVRKMREVKYRETLLELLTKQYEAARLDEAKEAAIIQVLDPAITPERRSRPQRGSILALSLLLAFAFAVGWSLAAEKFERCKENPQQIAQLHLLQGYLFPGSRR